MYWFYYKSVPAMCKDFTTAFEHALGQSDYNLIMGVVNDNHCTLAVKVLGGVLNFLSVVITSDVYYVFTG